MCSVLLCFLYYFDLIILPHKLPCLIRIKIQGKTEKVSLELFLWLSEGTPLVLSKKMCMAWPILKPLIWRKCVIKTYSYSVCLDSNTWQRTEGNSLSSICMHARIFTPCARESSIGCAAKRIRFWKSINLHAILFCCISPTRAGCYWLCWVILQMIDMCSYQIILFVSF